MKILFAAVLALMTQSSPGWEEAAKEDGVTVYSRERADSPVREMKAVGLIEGTPQEVWRAIRDYANYKKTMPYTEESKVLSVEDGGKVTYFYSLLDLPLVDKREYVIRIVDESEWKEGKGYFKASWKVHEGGPKEREDVVRVKINDGYWLLESRENGAKTFATYYVYTDPGGSLPKWIANRANSTAVPEVFLAIRKAIVHARAAK
ncbi:MAG: START domain-containing protein [Myxococcota bacterium]